MKIIRNTADELVVESRPWGVGIIVLLFTLAVAWAGISLLGRSQSATGLLILIGGGLLCLSAFWAFVRLEEVRFSRPDGTVQFRTRSLGGATADTIPLASIQSAVIQTKTSQGRNNSKRGRGTRMQTSRTFRPALKFADIGAADRPLTEIYTGSEAAHQAVVQAVNGWLSGQA